MCGKTNSRVKKKFPAYTMSPTIEEGFRQELVYFGVAGDVLKLAYREFSGGLARPAFTQEVTFTLESEGSTMIHFKGARIEIHEIDNSGVRYTVRQGIK